jgi:hypothetical protein
MSQRPFDPSHPTALLRVAVLLAGLSAPALGHAGALLWFVESEAGVAPYRTRIIVNDRYLRQDYGPDDPGFLLLDRREGVVYSVDGEQGSVLTIPSRPVEEAPPYDLDLAEASRVDEDAPAILGKRPTVVRYQAQGQPCYTTMSVPGLLAEPLAALRELAQVLAGQRAATLHNTPDAYWDACSLARHVFAPDRHLRHGFPVMEWDEAGYRRELIDFATDYAPDPGLFVVPTEYRRMGFAAAP